MPQTDQLQSLSSVLLWHVVRFLGGYASCYGVGCCVGYTVMGTIRHRHVKPVPYLHPTAWKGSRRLPCKLLNHYQNYNQIYWDFSDYFSEIHSKLRGEKSNPANRHKNKCMLHNFEGKKHIAPELPNFTTLLGIYIVLRDRKCKSYGMGTDFFICWS